MQMVVTIDKRIKQQDLSCQHTITTAMKVKHIASK